METHEDFEQFIHNQLHMLNNIATSIKPLLHYVPSNELMVNDRTFYFHKAKQHILNVVKLTDTLLSSMEKEERQINQSLILETVDINIRLNEYLTAREKFQPPFIFSVMSDYSSLLSLLKKEYLSKDSIRNIEKEIKEINSLVSEYFLKEANLQLQEMRDIFKKTITVLITSNATELNIEEVNIVEILEKVISKFRSSSDLKNIDFRRNWNSNRKHFVLADLTSLSVAFSNLVENAIKYNDTLTTYDVWIGIYIKEVGPLINVEFENWGPGIEKDEIEKGLIFKFGYRGKQAMNRDITGSGLGLYQAKKIIEHNNGTINVSSDKTQSKNNKYVNKFTVSLKRVL
jgi:signal transduction histidine kinase